MYEDFEHNFSTQKEKKITIYRNGNPDKMIILKLANPIKYHKIVQEIENRLPLSNIKKLRLFNNLGVEIQEDDLEFIKDGSALYASRGEPYDQNSSFSEYNIIQKIGQGGFGSVMLAEHKKTKEKVAIKIVNTGIIGKHKYDVKLSGNAQDIDMVFREAEMLKHLNHKNIVKIQNCFTLPNMQVVFVMEYLEGGELLDYVVTRGQLTEQEAKEFFKQIADGIYYCHHEKLIHRDLKLENILLTDKQSNHIKIVDFGIAGVSNIVNLSQSDAGSLKYLAPEIYLKKPNAVSPALDIWAMGVILFGMLCGELPFNCESNYDTATKISKADYQIPIKIKSKLSKPCIDMITRLLQIDLTKRININEIMEHEWIKEKYNNFMIEEQEQEEKDSDDEDEQQKKKKFTINEKRVQINDRKIDIDNIDKTSPKLPEKKNTAIKVYKQEKINTNDKNQSRQQMSPLKYQQKSNQKSPLRKK